MRENALELKQLYKCYSNGFEAVKHIDLTVEKGDFFALLGGNGAGKSTTISMITSLTRKTSGKIYIFDQDVDENFSRAKKYVGLVPQEFNFNVFEKSIDVVRNQAGFYNINIKEATERAEFYLNQLGLYEKRFEQTRHLSGGMKRRLMIARAMAHEPQLLILDEPTAGVDLEIRRSMWSFLRSLNDKGVTIILTTHYLEEAENLCRNVGIIHHGEIIHRSSMKELLNELDEETFVLEVGSKQIPADIQKVLNLTEIDRSTYEVRIPKAKGLNYIFEVFNKNDIKILSLRNKVNRLEELFLRLVGN